MDPSSRSPLWTKDPFLHLWTSLQAHFRILRPQVYPCRPQSQASALGAPELDHPHRPRIQASHCETRPTLVHSGPGTPLQTLASGWPQWIQCQAYLPVTWQNTSTLEDSRSKPAYKTHQMTCPESLDRLTREEFSLPKPVCKAWEEWLLLQIHRSQHKAISVTNNQEKHNNTTKERK